jgi:hypothetical protein
VFFFDASAKKKVTQSILFFLFEFQIDHLMNFFRAVAEKSLQITDETVDVSLSGGLQNDIFVVIIPEKF